MTTELLYLSGLGALCYYAAFSKDLSTFDRAAFWPEYVRSRIRDTYMYLAGSLGITGLSAYTVYTRAPRLLELVSRGGIIPMIGFFAAVVSTVLAVSFIQMRLSNHNVFLDRRLEPACCANRSTTSQAWA